MTRRRTRSSRRRQHGPDRQKPPADRRDTNDRSSERETPPPAHEDGPPIRKTTPAPFPEETIRADDSGRDARSFRHPVWLHPEVPDAVRERPPLFKRLGLLIEQLAAGGRTSVVKGCRPPNHGWYRAPLGGNRGSQYYLWWTRGTTPQTRLTDIPGEGIVIQAVRHHDDHRPLEARSRTDYLELRQPDQIDTHIAGSPWTGSQEEFTRSTAPVRVLEGRPGSGKTTALWHAVDARANERVLYLTWSTALTDEAKEHFESFSARSTTTVCRDFTSLLAELSGRDVERITLPESRRRLAAAMKGIDSRILKHWAFVQGGAHAEIRGVVLGYGQPGKRNSTEQDGCLRLTDSAYQKSRRLDEQSTTSMTRLMAALEPGTLPRVYPELHAAHDSLGRIASGDIPRWLTEIDRIVVDEAQDLTLTEMSVVVELATLIGNVNGHRPRLLVAGDEGQNVRPTAFQWAKVRNLMTERLEKPVVFTLERQVRCPRRIATIIDSASRLYTDLDKDDRPRHQHHDPSNDGADGHAMEVRTAGATGAADLIRRVHEIDGAAVISATDDVPEWLDPDARKLVLTPADAKGLEFQAACVLEPDRAVARASVPSLIAATLQQDQQEARRTAINELRVAVSRATETLAFIVSGEERRQDDTDKLLDTKTTTYEPDQLIEHLESGDKTPVERVTRIMAEAVKLREQSPDRAVLRSQQAIRLIGGPEDGNGVDDPAIRLDTARKSLEIAAWGMAHSTREEGDSTHHQLAFEAIRVKYDALKALGQSDNDQMFDTDLAFELDGWTKGYKELAPIVANLHTILHDETLATPYWAARAIESRRQELLDDVERSATTLDHAMTMRRNEVRAWFEAIDPGTDHEERVGTIARTAFDTVMADRPDLEGTVDEVKLVEIAEAMLVELDDDPMREGMVEEAEGRIEHAALCYERAGATSRLAKLVRDNALWERVTETRADGDHCDARWLLAIEQLVTEKPPNLGARLSPADRRRFSMSLEALADVIDSRGAD